MPRTFTCEVRPQRVARAVVGHVLGFGLNRVPSGPFEEALAAYFLDFSAPMPREAELFYWIYPYNDQVLVRDAMWMDTRVKGPPGVIFKLLKFHPFAFLLTWERHSAYNFGFRNLGQFRSYGIDDYAPLIVDRELLAKRRWPEAPVVDSSVTFYGRDAMVAQPRRN